MSVADIYDFEGAVEAAAAAIFEAAGVTAYTSQDAVIQQKERPHVEISFALGGGNQRFVTVTTTGAATTGWGNRRESAWDCELTISLITDADIASHTSYRVQIRNIAASLEQSINGSGTMANHKFTLTRDGGSSALMMDQDKGYFRTDFSYHGKISVQADAWALLAT